MGKRWAWPCCALLLHPGGFRPPQKQTGSSQYPSPTARNSRPKNTHKAHQYRTHLYSRQCKYCYLPEATQELCDRNEVSLISGVAVVPLPLCQWVTNSSTKRFYCFGWPLLSEPLQARLLPLWAPQTCRSSPQWHSGQISGCPMFCPQRGTSCLHSFQQFLVVLLKVNKGFSAFIIISKSYCSSISISGNFSSFPAKL